MIAFRKLVLSVFYATSFHFAYVVYINPNFEYAHYSYIPPTQNQLFITYFLTCVVVIFSRNTHHTSQALATLVYALAYVPIQLTLLFSVDRSYAEIVVPQIALAISMSVIFLGAAFGPLPQPRNKFDFAFLDGFLAILTTVIITIILIGSRDYIRITSFEDVYELRLDSSTSGSKNVLLGYLSSWVSYCFASYFFARAIVHRKYYLAILGVVVSIVLYATSGAKAAILLLPITIAVLFVWHNGAFFLSRLLAWFGTLNFGIALLPNDGLFIWLKSIVLVRMLGSSGWTASKYFEYFDENGYTLYTHIAPVKAVFGGYPYGELQLGQVIGLAYSGSTVANFNSGFWASDGFAAAGSIGILVVTLPVIVLLQLVNRLTAVFESRFTVAWMTGFAISLLNTPLSTSMLSNGGGVLLLVAFFATQIQLHSSIKLKKQTSL
jgi:hypothetical protein